MKAARYYGKADIRVDDVDEPQPGEGQVLVDVEWCGICGSDLHEYAVGPTSLPAPGESGQHNVQTLGHELCGIVRSPPAGSKFKDGDAVMVDPRVLCHSCAPCNAGSSHCCSNLGYIGGSTGFGGFGEKVVASEDCLYLLPPEIPLEHAAVLEPLVIVHHAIKVSGVKDFREKDVLVLGGGPIGFALLICLKAAGANKVIVSEPAAARRNQVAEFCQTVINPFEEDVEKRCMEVTDGRGVEIVFDCAGVPRALEGAINAMRFESLYMMVAVWEQPITIPCWKFLAKHITMKGTLIFDDDAMREVMEMIVEGKLVGFEKMVTGRIGIQDIVSKGFEELINHKDQHIKILTYNLNMGHLEECNRSVMATTGRADTIKNLTLAGKRIQEAQQTWKDDINRVKGQHNYKPTEPQIEPSTTISDALIILGRSLAHYNSRSQLHDRPSQGLTDLLRAHVKPRQSTVTKTWHAKRCLANVEQHLLARFRDLERAEELRSENLATLLELQSHLLEFEHSDHIALLVEAVALADRAYEALEYKKKAKAGVSSAEVDQLRWQLSTATDFTSELRALLSTHDRSVNVLFWSVSLIVGHVPRQMNIEEFFKPVGR